MYPRPYGTPYPYGPSSAWGSGGAPPGSWGANVSSPPPPTPAPLPSGPASVFQAVASYASNSVISTTNPTPIVFNVVRAGNVDGSFNIYNGTFVAPAPGLYQFDIAVSAAAATAAVAPVTVALTVDGAVRNSQTLQTAGALGSTVNINFSSTIDIVKSGSSVQVQWSSALEAGAATLQSQAHAAAAQTWFQGRSLF